MGSLAVFPLWSWILLLISAASFASAFWGVRYVKRQRAALPLFHLGQIYENYEVPFFIRHSVECTQEEVDRLVRKQKNKSWPIPVDYRIPTITLTDTMELELRTKYPDTNDLLNSADYVGVVRVDFTTPLGVEYNAAPFEIEGENYAILHYGANIHSSPEVHAYVPLKDDFDRICRLMVVEDPSLDTSVFELAEGPFLIGRPLA